MAEQDEITPFDSGRLAEELDAMSDSHTKAGSEYLLVAEIDEVRKRWPECREYPPCVWAKAYADFLAINPPGRKNHRPPFARVWVHNARRKGSEERTALHNAWLDYRKARGWKPGTPSEI